MASTDDEIAARQRWPRRDDITPHPLVEAVAKALAADHADCDPESCCQRNSGPDWVEAHKALTAINEAGYQLIEPARIRAVCRMLLDSGDTTSMGVRMIEKVCLMASGEIAALRAYDADEWPYPTHWSLFWMAAARATGTIVLPEVACRCGDFGFCARGDDGGDRICRYCTQRIDVVYDPCPIFGFGCGPGCDCCTPAQQEATRANA